MSRIDTKNTEIIAGMEEVISHIQHQEDVITFLKSDEYKTSIITEAFKLGTQEEFENFEDYEKNRAQLEHANAFLQNIADAQTKKIKTLEELIKDDVGEAIAQEIAELKKDNDKLNKDNTENQTTIHNIKKFWLDEDDENFSVAGAIVAMEDSVKDLDNAEGQNEIDKEEIVKLKKDNDKLKEQLKLERFTKDNEFQIKKIVELEEENKQLKKDNAEEINNIKQSYETLKSEFQGKRDALQQHNVILMEELCGRPDDEKDKEIFDLREENEKLTEEIEKNDEKQKEAWTEGYEEKEQEVTKKIEELKEELEKAKKDFHTISKAVDDKFASGKWVEGID